MNPKNFLNLQNFFIFNCFVFELFWIIYFIKLLLKNWLIYLLYIDHLSLNTDIDVLIKIINPPAKLSSVGNSCKIA